MNDFFNNLNEILKTGPIYLEKFEISINAIRKINEDIELSISFNKKSYDWINYIRFTAQFKIELHKYINKYSVNKNIWND